MTAILGISAFYHDSAAALVVDGEIVAAAQEERFTRKKHDPAFPSEPSLIVSRRRARPEELDYVAFYDKPLTKFERCWRPTWPSRRAASGVSAGHAAVAQGQAAHAADHPARSWRPTPGADRLHWTITRAMRPAHSSPARSSEAAILTLDGVGEWSTATYGIGCRQPDPS